MSLTVKQAEFLERVKQGPELEPEGTRRIGWLRTAKSLEAKEKVTLDSHNGKVRASFVRPPSDDSTLEQAERIENFMTGIFTFRVSSWFRIFLLAAAASCFTMPYAVMHGNVPVVAVSTFAFFSVVGFLLVSMAFEK